MMISYQELVRTFPNTNSIHDNNFTPTYLPFTVIAHYNLELKKCITGFHLHNRRCILEALPALQEKPLKSIQAKHLNSLFI